MQPSPPAGPPKPKVEWAARFHRLSMNETEPPQLLDIDGDDEDWSLPDIDALWTKPAQAADAEPVQGGEMVNVDDRCARVRFVQELPCSLSSH